MPKFLEKDRFLGVIALCIFLVIFFLLLLTKQLFIIFKFVNIFSWISFIWLILSFILLLFFIISLFFKSLSAGFALFKYFLYFYFFISLTVIITFFVFRTPFESKTAVSSTSVPSKVDQKQIEDCNGVYLQMELVDYPKKVTSLCQPVAYKIKITNIGNKLLLHSNLSEEFYFDFSGETTSTGGTNDIYKVKDFGSIQPKETKIIEVYNKTTGNGFDNLDSGKKTNMMVLFIRKLKEAKTYPVCANAIEYSVYVDSNVNSRQDRISCYGME